MTAPASSTTVPAMTRVWRTNQPLRRCLFGALLVLACDAKIPEPASSVASAARPAPKPIKYDYAFLDPRLSVDARAADIVKRLKLEEKIAQLSHAAPAIARLGIPEYNWWNEALHGVARNGRATVFPQAIGMAASFDPELLGQVATAIADEARAKFNRARELGNRGPYSGLTFWSPNINIFRD